jgi:cytochrome c-type biogenesis protein
VAVLFALLAGILTIAAPCTLPVLPILLGGSVGQTSRWRPVFIALGFTTSFAAVVLVFSAVTQVAGIDQDTLRTLAVMLLVVFGFLMLSPRSLEALAARCGSLVVRLSGPQPWKWSGNVGGFVLGTTLGLVWTPCAGPILASILTVIATSAEFSRGALLLLVYAIGAGVPMLAIAYGGQVVTTKVRRIACFSGQLQQGFGVVIILLAIAMYSQHDTLITAWLSGFYPTGRVGL